MKDRTFLKTIYLLALTIMAITGFGQMPIFKRYYMADIPGFGWTADYYFTHYIHYMVAIFLIGLFSFLIVDFFLIGRKEFKVSLSSYLRIFLLTAIVLTGIFRVLLILHQVVQAMNMCIL